MARRETITTKNVGIEFGLTEEEVYSLRKTLNIVEYQPQSVLK